MVDFFALRDEITVDPEDFGYNGVGSENPGPGPMTDKQVAVFLSDATQRSRDKERMEATEVANAVDETEFVGKTADQQAEIYSLLAMGNLDPRDGSLYARRFVSIFTGGSATITALNAARVEAISRAAEVGIGGRVGEGHVAHARTL